MTAPKLDFSYFSIWYNVKFHVILTPKYKRDFYSDVYTISKMIWEPLNCGSYLDKVYL